MQNTFSVALACFFTLADTSLQEPFITSLKNIDDDFVVIPLKYFEKKILKSKSYSGDDQALSKIRKLVGQKDEHSILYGW